MHTQQTIQIKHTAIFFPWNVSELWKKFLKIISTSNIKSQDWTIVKQITFQELTEQCQRGAKIVFIKLSLSRSLCKLDLIYTYIMQKSAITCIIDLLSQSVSI